MKSGTVVITKEENLPLLKWTLGRIIKTTPGEDRLVRVVNVGIANGVLFYYIKRSATRREISN